MELFLSDQELERHEELRQLRALGIDPYPAAAFPVNAHAADIESGYAPGVAGFEALALAGRISNKRIMGKASFAELRDSTGMVQLYISRDELCPGEDKGLYNEVFKKLISNGDIIGVHGHAFVTQTGEKTVHVQELVLLSKALRPIAFPKAAEGHVYETLTDTELRYRQRYYDLIVHPEVREVFRQRARIISTMRAYFDAQGWLEVETPILQPIHGGASARPFATHHHSLDMPLYLRIANELYLKRLIVGGFEGVYEFGKMFRNEGMDRTHNPEFTSVELYVAYQDYTWMMQMTETVLAQVAQALHGGTVVRVGAHEIDFGGPYRRLSISAAILEYAGIDVEGLDDAALRAAASAAGVAVTAGMGRGKLIDELFGETVEHHLIQPTFVMDYPVEMSPLTKRHRSKPGLVERFELYVNGKEVANAYSELNDPIEQRARFEAQLRLREAGDEEAMALDEDFLRALEYGMPPTSGIGIGIDRLTMFMTNHASIQDVLFFPQMKPEANPMHHAAPRQVFVSAGVPEHWVDCLYRSGVYSLADLRAANPNKLHQDLCGLNKKYKLGHENPRLEEVRVWAAG